MRRVGLQGRPLPASTVRPTNPLLLDVPPTYLDAEYKVMVFGKETNDWEGAFPHQGGIGHLLDTYRAFFNEGYCYSYGGQYWNGIKDFKSRLQERCRASGKSLHLLWNNVIKIGKECEKGAPPEAILDWEDEWFDVVSFEVSELRPNIVVFFSGPDYDRSIERIFPSASFDSVNRRPTRHLARVTASGVLPDGSTIRAYHPNYLYRRGGDWLAEYMAEIVTAIRM